MSDKENNQVTADSAERYILRHKIDTVRWLSFVSGLVFGVLFMFLAYTVLNLEEMYHAS